jgi:carbamoylphosphate synthase small subunit
MLVDINFYFRMPLKKEDLELIEDIKQRKVTDKIRTHGIIQKVIEKDSLCGTSTLIITNGLDGIHTIYCTNGDVKGYLQKLQKLYEDSAMKGGAEAFKKGEDYIQEFTKETAIDAFKERIVKYTKPY